MISKFKQQINSIVNLRNPTHSLQITIPSNKMSSCTVYIPSFFREDSHSKKTKDVLQRNVDLIFINQPIDPLLG